jgi:hypothetical protein
MCRLSRNPGALTSRTPQGHVGLLRGYLTFFTVKKYIQDQKFQILKCVRNNIVLTKWGKLNTNMAVKRLQLAQFFYYLLYLRSAYELSINEARSVWRSQQKPRVLFALINCLKTISLQQKELKYNIYTTYNLQFCQHSLSIAFFLSLSVGLVITLSFSSKNVTRYEIFAT